MYCLKLVVKADSDPFQTHHLTFFEKLCQDMHFWFYVTDITLLQLLPSITIVLVCESGIFRALGFRNPCSAAFFFFFGENEPVR